MNDKHHDFHFEYILVPTIDQSPFGALKLIQRFNYTAILSEFYMTCKDIMRSDIIEYKVNLLTLKLYSSLHAEYFPSEKSDWADDGYNPNEPINL